MNFLCHNKMDAINQIDKIQPPKLGKKHRIFGEEN
jgi:hypothetical protein